MSIEETNKQEEQIRRVPLPVFTETYTVISHGSVIDEMKKNCEKQGFQYESVNYLSYEDGEIVRAQIVVSSTTDPDMGMLITWINSYNKKVKFSCAIGGFIYDNDTAFIGSEGTSWVRKHTGTADKEAYQIIEELIGKAAEHFQKLIVEKERMKVQPIDDSIFGCIMGALYFEKDLLTPTQASAIKNERKKSVHVYKDKATLWGLYKFLMFGIKDALPAKWQTCQQKLHYVIMNEYALAVEEKGSISLGTQGSEDTAFAWEDPALRASFSHLSDEEFIKLNTPQPVEQDPYMIKRAQEDAAKARIDLSSIEGEYSLDEMPAVLETIESKIKEALPQDRVEAYIEKGFMDEEKDMEDLEEEDESELIEEIQEETLEEETMTDVLDMSPLPVELIAPDHLEEEEEEEGLDIPEEVLAEAKMVEAKMLKLYGSIRPYLIERKDKQLNVTIEATHESFYITL